MNDYNLDLCDAIALRISQCPQQRITFAEYMDLVLYHPQHGYYATNKVNIGAQGDFFTSPHLSADFGELLTEQFVQMWQILDCPVPFTLVEMGAGQGILAGDVLRYSQRQYPDFFNAIEYIIVEKSPALKKEQQQRLKELPIRWCAIEEIPTETIIGCCFSNELVDALPVHQFVIENGKLSEIYVTNQDSINFVEVADEPSTNELIKYFELVEIDLISPAYPDVYRSEVNLAALDWLSTVADKLQRGYLLTVDYGYIASRYYSPGRDRGTLQCYYQHAHHDNPYINIGRQDITAHVNFTALERWGELCRLQKIGFTQQGLFLMALGLGNRIASLSSSNATDGKAILQVLQRRDALHQMINPMGLGGFGVLVQSKGLSLQEMAQTLKGLSIPNSPTLT
ncbi:class I SAM-dependent methyltransferase [Argonema galeatum]|uniref:class I SAM-dependent methyltransferase n=1 Tax=Argonema galeatum TaxID=2942762 RepID=UPI002012392A|nr:class I SAM-dependent methyltransferase [Argonema galeatum]MCL1464226.1 class I SAM-dependent methyltransferase [Argonema galeatum A003/A1]